MLIACYKHLAPTERNTEPIRAAGWLSLIRPEYREDLYKYITGIVKNKGQKLNSINGMTDHVHILIGLKPAMALADLVQDIKADSSNFINQRKWIRGKLSWQEG